MKSPLRMLREFAFHKHDAKEKDNHKEMELDELVEAAKDIQDLRNCYDSIITAAATTANNAYESSEALEELGACFLQKTGMSNEECGSRALTMLGEVQFELKKLFNGYRAHIFQTMVKPSKSFLKELEILEEMKIQCDTKRELYENMLLTRKERRKSRNAKSETVTLKELQEVQSGYEEEASLFIFRLKSLKQGQFRSFLTQAARHYAAQLNFFRKGLKTLEAVEPYVKTVADQHHIEFYFDELEDDESFDNDNDYDGELSFDYELNRQGQDVINVSRSFEEETTDRSQSLCNFSLRMMPSSHSAPISAGNASEQRTQAQPSSRKLHTYVLPTPVIDIKPNLSSPNYTANSETKDIWLNLSPLNGKVPTKNLRESEQLNRTKSPSPYTNKGGNVLSGPIPINARSGYSEGISFPQLNPLGTSDTKTFNRQAFSGPISSTPNASKPRYSTSEYETLSNVRPLVSVPASHVSTVSPPKRTSPPFVSSPKISELHELPRPPVSPEKVVSSSSLVGYSGPLVSTSQVLVARNKIPLDVYSKMSPLPAPPGPIKRSFSIPSRGKKVTVLSDAKAVEACDLLNSNEKVVLPASIPSSLATLCTVSPTRGTK